MYISVLSFYLFIFMQETCFREKCRNKMPSKVSTSVLLHDKKCHFTDFTFAIKFIKLYALEHQPSQTQFSQKLCHATLTER